MPGGPVRGRPGATPRARVGWGIALVAMTLPALVALAGPASAEAAMRYEGGTGQGKPIKLRTNGRGVVNRVRVGGAVRCANGARLHGASVFTRPFKRANPMGFRDTDRVSRRSRGIRTVIRDSITGRFVNRNRRRIKGRYRVAISYYAGGRRVGRCTLSTPWRAGLVA